MKIILSHDVDHLSWSEHWKDKYFPGLLYRSLKGLGSSGISLKHLAGRFLNGRLTHAEELHAFNQTVGAPSTFFFGMANGLQLSYAWRTAGNLIQRLHKQGAHIGLHGMRYDSKEGLQEEKKRILSFLPENYPIGVRNHYLRLNDHTLNYMSQLDFLFDSTHYSFEAPFRVGNMWEIPIGFMDAGHITHGKNDAKRLREITLERLHKAERQKQPFFVVNFHDTYFTPSYPFHYEWYQWLVDHLSRQGYEFTDFVDATAFLNSHESN